MRKPRDMISGLLSILALAVFLSACSTTETRHGHLLPKDIAQELATANISQARVVDLLGSPSAISAFDRNKWYYVSEIQHTVAFFRPDTVRRSVLILQFDPSLQLAKVATLSETDGKEIALVSRETPTKGHQITIMEQLLGNIGRFTPES